MMRNFLLTLTTTALIAFPAGADPSQQEVDTARSECRDAFLARDAEAYIPAYSPNTRFQSARERVGDGFDLFCGFGTASRDGSGVIQAADG